MRRSASLRLALPLFLWIILAGDACAHLIVAQVMCEEAQRWAVNLAGVVLARGWLRFGRAAVRSGRKPLAIVRQSQSAGWRRGVCRGQYLHGYRWHDVW